MEPTEEGKRRYPPHGVFQAAPGADPAACTCELDCSENCIGDCGCLACALRFCAQSEAAAEKT